MKFSDIFSLAFRTVKANRLRSVLTIAIIAFGIMALIGIITAIKAMNQKMTESFSTMGANGFTVRYKERNIRIGGGGSEIKKSKKGSKKQRTSNLGKNITYREAESFKENYQFPALTSLSVTASRNSTVSFDTKKTSPNVFLFGSDENYMLLNGFKLEAGRNMNISDVNSAANVCLLGYDVAGTLFNKKPQTAINKTIRVNNKPLRVIGVLGSRGSTFGFSRDNVVLTSYRNIENNFSSGFSYTIGIQVDDIANMEEAMGEAEGAFRPIRKLATTEESNFVLDKSDSIVETAMRSLGFLTISATVIGLITLIGAAIGLMNIMLVSVSERTKEVGLVKAIGGKSKMVRQQFLLEAIIISILGAIFGILLGIIVGNVFSLVLKTGFVIPWDWVFYGVFICTMVGLLAGLYPAVKAGKLNPIDALRYE
jgi:putative ABC transport system permease protein